MIVDSLKSFEKYITLHKDFDKVYQFTREHDLDQLKPGNHSIVPDQVWCTVVEKDLDLSSAADQPYQLEVHDSFIDIYVIISGNDVIGFKSRQDCPVEGWKYDEKNDAATIEEVPDVFMNVAEKNVVILFPSDAHCAMLGEGHLKKAIFKVRL